MQPTLKAPELAAYALLRSVNETPVSILIATHKGVAEVNLSSRQLWNGGTLG